MFNNSLKYRLRKQNLFNKIINLKIHTKKGFSYFKEKVTYYALKNKVFENKNLNECI